MSPFRYHLSLVLSDGTWLVDELDEAEAEQP